MVGDGANDDAPHGVVVTNDSAVRIITIDRPGRRNAVDSQTAAALRIQFEAFDTDETASVAVLTGSGGISVPAPTSKRSPRAIGAQSVTRDRDRWGQPDCACRSR